MSTIQLELPESVLKEARKLASQDKIPLDYYVALIVTRHIAARQGIEYLKRRGEGASRERPPEKRFERGYGLLFSRECTQAEEGCDFKFLHSGGRATPEPDIY